MRLPLRASHSRARQCVVVKKNISSSNLSVMHTTVHVMKSGEPAPVLALQRRPLACLTKIWVLERVGKLRRRVRVVCFLPASCLSPSREWPDRPAQRAWASAKRVHECLKQKGLAELLSPYCSCDLGMFGLALFFNVINSIIRSHSVQQPEIHACCSVIGGPLRCSVKAFSPFSHCHHLF